MSNTRVIYRYLLSHQHHEQTFEIDLPDSPDYSIRVLELYLDSRFCSPAVLIECSTHAPNDCPYSALQIVMRIIDMPFIPVEGEVYLGSIDRQLQNLHTEIWSYYLLPERKSYPIVRDEAVQVVQPTGP